MSRELSYLFLLVFCQLNIWEFPTYFQGWLMMIACNLRRVLWEDSKVGSTSYLLEAEHSLSSQFFGVCKSIGVPFLFYLINFERSLVLAPTYHLAFWRHLQGINHNHSKNSLNFPIRMIITPPKQQIRKKGQDADTQKQE